MKIFWSWQSDTPGKAGRHFVREALEEVVSRLKAELTIEEPGREELHLDHDRKGVPGSPDLAATILEKIRESSIFIADVTPVGRSDDGRALLNPNVAIELGYALAHVGSEGLLMVLNSNFGDRGSLPFDLRHKAGPIIFNLAPDANSEERKRVKRDLTQTLTTAIKECLQHVKHGGRVPAHEEISTRFSVAQYFDTGETLADRQGAKKLRYPESPLLYLRVIPTTGMPALRQAEMKDVAFGIKLKPLLQDHPQGGWWDRNSFGAITYAYDPDTDPEHILASSQIFANREIWGIDATILDRRNLKMSSLAIEEELETGLKHYLEVGQRRLNLRCPLIVEAGATRLYGFRMEIGNGVFRGPLYTSEIRSRQTLASFEAPEVDRVLLAIFEDFFDAVGERRPQYFREFPPVI